MKLIFRTTAPTKRLYIARQNTQTEGQTRSIEHLQADMGEDSKDFSPKWASHRESLDTGDFQQELERVLEALVGDEQYDRFLKSRNAIRDFCWGYQESGYDNDFASSFWADIAQYTYLVWLHPYKGEEDLFPYRCHRDWLDRHMEQAEKGIRFIGPYYKELFHISDSGQIHILREGCTSIDRICRYIDDCCAEIGSGQNSLFHICQSVEQMEHCHSTVLPLASSLPEKCFAILPSSGELIVIERYKPGYQTPPMAHFKGRTPRQMTGVFNGDMGTIRTQATAMLARVTQGWTSPVANPSRCNKRGQPVKPRCHEGGGS